jgi:hypothetical protein
MSFPSSKDFDKAFVLYDSVKKAKSGPAKSGKQVFTWNKHKFNHISVIGNKVDYLVYKGVVICSFPNGKKRENVYKFIDKHWTNIIEPFCKYINNRTEYE